MDLSRELTDEEVEELIMQEILRFSSRKYLLLEEKLRIQKELFNGIRRLDLLQELIEDPLVTAMMAPGISLWKRAGICSGGTSNLHQRKNWRMWFSRL